MASYIMDCSTWECALVVDALLAPPKDQWAQQAIHQSLPDPRCSLPAAAGGAAAASSAAAAAAASTVSTSACRPGALQKSAHSGAQKARRVFLAPQRRHQRLDGAEGLPWRAGQQPAAACVYDAEALDSLQDVLVKDCASSTTKRQKVTCARGDCSYSTRCAATVALRPATSDGVASAPTDAPACAGPPPSRPAACPLCRRWWRVRMLAWLHSPSSTLMTLSGTTMTS